VTPVTNNDIPMMIKVIAITNPAGIQNGANTHSHEIAITFVNFKISKTINVIEQRGNDVLPTVAGADDDDSCLMLFLSIAFSFEIFLFIKLAYI
jgi:hypothetical protein